MINKKNLRNLIKAVDTILWHEWNPIGCDVPEDEYTSYALVVTGKVLREETEQAVLDYLFWVENNCMGGNKSKTDVNHRNKPIVEKIIHLVSSLSNN